MIRLFELCTSDCEYRMSPYVWRVRFALMHKGLEFEGIPLRFLDKDPIAPAQSKTVPVIQDGDIWMRDSFDIVCYLDETYPDKPLIKDLAAARFFNSWLYRSVVSPLFPMLVSDIIKSLDADNAAYFRETRQKLFGDTPLEEVSADREAMRPAFLKGIAPMRDVLKGQPFLCGDEPAWADYAAAASFVWALTAKGFDPIEGDEVLSNWRSRMFDLFDGHVHSAMKVNG